MSATYIKLFIGVMLFITWVALVVFKVPGSEDIITAIKLALAGLGAYHLNDRTNQSATTITRVGDAQVSKTTPIDPQGGYASPFQLTLLGCISAFVVVFWLSSCALPLTPLTPDQITTQINKQVCPIATATIAAIPTLPNIDATALTKLPDISKVVDVVCTAGAALKSVDLKTLAADALPTMLNIVKAIPNPDPRINALIDGIVLAQILLPTLIAQLP